MSAPKTSFLSTDLLRETRTLLGQRPRTPDAEAAAPAAPERERLYLRYGEQVLRVLEQAGDPVSDRDIFKLIKLGGFAELQVALAELVRRGMIRQLDTDPDFGDPRYGLAPVPPA